MDAFDALLSFLSCGMAGRLRSAVKNEEGAVYLRKQEDAIPAPDPLIAKKLFECYARIADAFPQWSLDVDLSKYAHSVLTFCNDKDDVRVVKTLLREREPVNIEMMRAHDAKAFAQLTATVDEEGKGGWQSSAYIRHFETTSELPPNLAVYIETPALPYDRQNSVTTFDENKALTLRVLNMIGYGFDVSTQPDALYFAKRPAADLCAAQRLAFVKILGCVRHLNRPGGGGTPIRWMHVPGFGCGAFAGDRADEVNDNFDALFAEFEPLWAALGVTASREYIYPSRNGEFNNNTLQLYPVWQAYARGDHPDGFGDLNGRLFINAWDPHSLVGNGNFQDASMDGYYGRSTAMALLCWPPTNPLMKESNRILAVDANGNCSPTTTRV